MHGRRTPRGNLRVVRSERQRRRHERQTQAVRRAHRAAPQALLGRRVRQPSNTSGRIANVRSTTMTRCRALAAQFRIEAVPHVAQPDLIARFEARSRPSTAPHPRRAARPRHPRAAMSTDTSGSPTRVVVTVITSVPVDAAPRDRSLGVASTACPTTPKGDPPAGTSLQHLGAVTPQPDGARGCPVGLVPVSQDLPTSPSGLPSASMAGWAGCRVRVRPCPPASKRRLRSVRERTVVVRRNGVRH